MRREKNAQHIAEALAPQVELLRRKPSRPRGPVFVDGVVRWDPPKETRNVTHFNIYADDDKNLSARLSLGQTEHVLIADRVYISSYNERSGLESARVMAERTGEVTPGGVPESVAERLDDVTGLTGRYEYRDLKDGKGLRLALAIRANLPSPIYGMKGLQSYIENPDRSAGGAGIKADGSTKADGSAQAGGEWSPKPGPRRPYLANEEFIIDGLDPVKQQTKIRVYLATYGAKTENELVRANTTGATPSVVITVDPPADLPPSTKAAPLVKFFTVVENLGKVDSYGVNGAGQRALFPAMAWVIPVGVFGVALFVIRDGGRHQRLTHGLWYGDDYRAEILDFPYEDERVRFYALSANEQGQVNEYAPGVTPYVDTILAAPPVEEAGKEYTSRVVSFDVGDAVFWPPNSEGQEAWATFPVTAVLPRDPTFGAWSLWVIVPWQTEHIQVSGWESGTEIPVKIPYTPGATQSWTFYALSRDVNQRANTYVASGPFATPSETLLMSPPPLGSAGIEHTSLVSLLSGGASIQYRQTADGVEEWRLKLQWQPPNDDTFGQMKYSIERTSGTAEYVETEFAGDTGTVSYTKWRAFVVGEVYTAWFGSVSVNSRENSLVAGVTPRVTGLAPTLQTGGALKGDRLAAGSILTAAAFAATVKPPEVVTSLPFLPDTVYPIGRLVFLTLDQKLYRSLGASWTKAVDGTDLIANSVVAGKIAAGAVSTTELFAGEILLGQGGGKPTRMKVVDSLGSSIGFWGDDSTIPFLGLYTSRLKVAPTILTSSPRLEMNGSLLEMVGGTMELTLNNALTKIKNDAFTLFGISFAGMSINSTIVPAAGSYIGAGVLSHNGGNNSGSIISSAGGPATAAFYDTAGTAGLVLQANSQAVYSGGGGATGPAVLISGNYVLRARYPVRPVTLADVIALQVYHGQCV